MRRLIASPLRRLALGLVAALVLLAVVLVARAAFFASRQVAVEPATSVPVDAGAAAGRLARALRFQTISYSDESLRRPEEFAAFHAYIRETFPRVHAALQREALENGSVLYTWRGTDPELRPILLMGHVDVVPVGPGTEGDWTHPPFGGVIADGYVWRRGAVDDKAGVIGILEATEALLAAGYQPRRTVYLAFGADEEQGGDEGAALIAALLKARGQALEFVLDEGGLISHVFPGLDDPVALVGIAEKGAVSVELSVRGEGGHSSMPPPSTTVGILSRAVHRLEENPLPGRFAGPVRALFDYIGPEMSLAPRLVFANSWLFAPLIERQLAASPQSNALLRTTTAATMFQGGVKENVLPATAHAVVNFRILPGDSVAGVVQHIRETIDGPRVQLRLVGRQTEPSPVSSAASPSWAVLERTIRQVFPDVVVAPFLTPGGTDARHFRMLTQNVYRFLPIRSTAEDPAILHGTDERVSVRDYARAVQFYALLITNATSAPVR